MEKATAHHISDNLLKLLIENAYSKGRLSKSVDQDYDEGLSQCTEFIISVISC